MHPQMIKCFMALLNGFLKKSRPPITLREKYYLLAFTKIGDLIKKTTYDFLAEKTSVERDGVPRPMD